MIQVNVRDPRPIYEQVKDGFRRLILSGALPPDTRLPSVRELAASLAINPNTIQRAYRELEAEGCISTAPGRGCFVCAADPVREARLREVTERLRAAARELRALGLSEEEIARRCKEGESDD
ncbi:MAG: GntR family transcriptional regulator [Oscillospiraceae bacterium]|nr:GntR family transcriptional regulator [Oscillospiraceae bacterium]